MLIQCTTGFENFSTSSAKAHVFVVPTARMLGKEMHIAVACKGVYPGLRKVGLETKQPAAPGLRRELGEWTTASYEVPEGMLLKVFGTRSGGWGSQRVMSNQFIRVRADAAMRRINVILTGNERAALARASIEGRFDLVTLSEALLMGVAVPPSFRPGFDEAMQRRAFEYHEVEPELRSVAVAQTRVVTNAAGEEREVSTNIRHRALDL
jgi:hypothetical protein